MSRLPRLPVARHLHEAEKEMIKQLIHSITACLMCLFFLIAGTGYNAVHYCCDACRQAGIEHVEEESCEAIHHHEEHHHDGHCHHHNSCWFKHLQVDEAGISQSLHLPAVCELAILWAESLEAEPAICLCHADSRPFYSDSSPDGDVGQTVLKRVCRWII